MEKQKSNMNSNKVKLMCSYGGKIQPRPTDHQLSYIGGDIKILTVDRNINFSEMTAKLNSLCNINKNSEVCIKYQLPGEDLDSLVSLINDEDVEHMMVEYDRMLTISTKPVRLRLFIFHISSPRIPYANPGNKNSDPDTPLNPDYLFGFDKEYQPSIGPPLDILQIPGMVLPENFGVDAGAGIEVKREINNVNAAAAKAVYRIPVVADGAGRYGYRVGPGAVNFNGEQALYNFVAVTPSVSVPERTMLTSIGNGHGMKINQRNI
ncbi:chromatin modification-related eaf-1-like isoform X2 [Olea europaea subsp. europaea]|uniref:Chromatin modification-related eaf-1-like isoform X2 n=1 Tax=Olea europaea subsp. europaea TaxID=158383 RepID=A0A8S0T347_OLEEU|nr:chromatin modification-related eaf-1-like isoform X2 [Olea europaea subsp. europaea]